mmetsp:Transcript_70430/g.197533  ORF Transcript_70430/g.197533 Transcript_70430/m.197533 type:complete len:131 (-) Transcript_70430:161-553(-)
MNEPSLLLLVVICCSPTSSVSSFRFMMIFIAHRKRFTTFFFINICMLVHSFLFDHGLEDHLFSNQPFSSFSCSPSLTPCDGSLADPVFEDRKEKNKNENTHKKYNTGNIDFARWRSLTISLGVVVISLLY